MDDETAKQLAQQYQNLPPEVQRAISAADLPEKLQQIVQKNKLLIDQAGALATEVDIILFGLEPLDHFIGNLERELALSHDKILAIGHDIDELIFKNVRDSLKKINEAVNITSTETQTTTQLAQEDLTSKSENPTTTNATPITVLKTQTTPTPNINIEVRPNMLPEIESKTYTLKEKTVPYHENISPLSNIIEAKTTNSVIVPKETIVVEEKTKLPEKSSKVTDPYREAIN